MVYGDFMGRRRAIGGSPSLGVFFYINYLLGRLS